MNPDLKPVLSTEIAVRWADMDAYNHVNNAMYLRYMEEIRVQFMYKMGFVLDGKGTGPVIINALSTFLISAEYPDTIRVEFFVDKPGNSSFMSYYRLYSNQLDGALVCEGEAKIVWVNYEENKSVPIPDNIRQLIEQPRPL